ncbi:MAG: metal-dependent transcriptional regulator [Flavobacteriaceae bacterium]|nr:metal-dependent transcriptional regulator [Flavobacteriaceae bacterium]
MITFSEENYLKAIYHHSKDYPNGVSTNAIAKSMCTKASSVTDMLKKLSEKKLVNYKKYQGVLLTKQGEKKAVNLIRRHRLWEVFLLEKLNFTWDEVHEVAEELEHIKSEKLINELDRLLDFPKKDPHGDPIPDKDGNFTKDIKVLLSTLNEKETGICVGVNDTSTDFLKYLNKQNIAIGKHITVVEKEVFDGSILIKIEDNQFYISHQIAKNLFLQLQ